MYYTKNILFSTPGAPVMTPQQKFVLIESIYLHFSDNTTLTLQHGLRAKIVPIYDYLADAFYFNYIAERDVSIDRSLLLWEECLSWKQYLTSKHSHFRLKHDLLRIICICRS